MILLEAERAHPRVGTAAGIVFVVGVARRFVVENRDRGIGQHAQRDRADDGPGRVAEAQGEVFVPLAQHVIEDGDHDGQVGCAGHKNQRAGAIRIQHVGLAGEGQRAGHLGVVHRVAGRAIMGGVSDRDLVHRAAGAADGDWDEAGVFINVHVARGEGDGTLVIHDEQHRIADRTHGGVRARRTEHQRHRLIGLGLEIIGDRHVDDGVGLTGDKVYGQARVGEIQRRAGAGIGGGEEDADCVVGAAKTVDDDFGNATVLGKPEQVRRERERRVIVFDEERRAALAAQRHAASGVGEEEQDGFRRLDHGVIDEGNAEGLERLSRRETERPVRAEIVRTARRRAREDAVIDGGRDVGAAGAQHGDDGWPRVFIDVIAGRGELNRAVIGDQDHGGGATGHRVARSFQQGDNEGFGNLFLGIIKRNDVNENRVGSRRNGDDAVRPEGHVIVAAARRPAHREGDRQRRVGRPDARDPELPDLRPKLVGQRRERADADGGGTHIHDGDGVRSRIGEECVRGHSRDVGEHRRRHRVGVPQHVGREAPRIRERQRQRLVPACHEIVQDGNSDGPQTIFGIGELRLRIGREEVGEAQEAGHAHDGCVVHAGHRAAGSRDPVFDHDGPVGGRVGTDLQPERDGAIVFADEGVAQHEAHSRQLAGVILPDGDPATAGIAHEVVRPRQQAEDHRVVSADVAALKEIILDGSNVDLRKGRPNRNQHIGADGRVISPFPRRAAHLEGDKQSVRGRSRPGDKELAGPAALGRRSRRHGQGHSRQRGLHDGDRGRVLVVDVVGGAVRKQHGDGL